MTTTKNRKLAICSSCCDYKHVCRDCGLCEGCSKHPACVEVPTQDDNE